MKLRNQTPAGAVTIKVSYWKDSYWKVSYCSERGCFSSPLAKGGLRGVARSRENLPQPGRRAFTLVELLVVMVIMTILISAVMVAAPALIGRARTSNTRAMLTIVQTAVDEFRREQKSKPTVAKMKAYRKRYGEYPPDELEVFTGFGVPARGGGTGISLAPGGGEMIPAAGGGSGYRPMKFYARGLPAAETATEYRDQVAMIVAIQLLGDTSASILAGVQDQYWSAPLDATVNKNPAVFVDRNGNGMWDANDHQVRYIIDDWDNPISYMAQRDFDEAARTHLASSNHPAWNEGVTEMIGLNGGKPIIFSYGPDGAEQLTEEQMGNEATASLIMDFEDDHIVNHPLNADNIYSNPALKELLAKGIAERD